VEINDFRTSSSGKQRQCGKLEISGDYLFEVGIRAVIVMSVCTSLAKGIGQNRQKTNRTKQFTVT